MNFNIYEVLNYLFLLTCLFNLQCYASDAIPTALTEVSASTNDLKGKLKDLSEIPQIQNWKQQCKAKVGRKKFRHIQKIPDLMMKCVQQYIKIQNLEAEINESRVGGELELVFEKYCGYRTQIMDCIKDQLDPVRVCLSEEQLENLNVTLGAVDAAIDFTCYEKGDRIALFLAEGGVECLYNSTEGIRLCMEENFSVMNDTKMDVNSIDIDQLLLNDENCKKIRVSHTCIESVTSQCPDSTPANVIDSLIRQALKETPCAIVDPGSGSSVAALSLTVILAAVTAANILL